MRYLSLSVHGSSPLELAASATSAGVSTGLAPLFDQVVTSHELGHPKDDQIFWEKLHLLEAFDPKRTLFIDDNLTVLEAAACYGIRHLLAVSRPDLTQPMRTLPGNFTRLDHFDDLLPSNCPRLIL